MKEIPPSSPYSELYLFDRLILSAAQPALAFEFQVVTRSGQVVGVIVQMLVDRSPESRVPVTIETEIAFVRKLQHGAVRVCLEVQSKRNIEVAGTQVEAADVSHCVACRSRAG